jgi:hypothetical protein
MDINLTIVFSAVIIVAIINIAAFIMLNKRISSSQEASSAEANELSNKLAEALSTFRLEMKETLSAIHAESSQLQDKFKQDVLDAFQQQDLKQNANFLALQQFNEKIAAQHVADAKAQSEQVSALFNQSTEHFNTIQKQLNDLVVENFDELQKLAKQHSFSNRQQQLSSFEQLTSQVHTLRIENAVELTNALCKHQELKVNTDDFVKHLGDCKVLKIEDKLTGQYTLVTYENGLKTSTSTYAGEHLKYQMFFDEAGKAERGIELNAQGEIAFEYYYDKAGEVSKRIEFVYDTAHAEPKKVEKIYEGVL